jgi:myo-inositol catabolism protein IolC
MTFEEDFPLLDALMKKKGYSVFDYLEESDFSETTIDKQRVREAIERFLKTEYYFHPNNIEEAYEQQRRNIETTNKALRELRQELNI